MDLSKYVSQGAPADPQDAIEAATGRYRDQCDVLTPQPKYANLALPAAPGPQPFSNLSSPTGPGRSG